MTEQGYGDDMLAMLFNEGKTSFATMFRDGAASIWECFETPPKTGGVTSLNHPMQAAFTSWLYTHLLGIAPTRRRRPVSSGSRCGLVMCWAA